MKTRSKNFSPSHLVSTLNDHNDGHSFVFIYITNECQLNCAHCSFQPGPMQSHTRLIGDVLLRALDEMRGVKDITLTGGEPMLHPEFKTILSKSAEQAQAVYLMTNGIHLIGKDRLRTLARREDYHELTKRLKGSLESFPENVCIFFPLDSFHVKTFKPFSFLLR